MNKKIIHINETDSTNNYIKTLSDGGGIDDMLVVAADYQSAGRGQGSNSWESNRGQNLLFSLCLHPVMVPVARQFLLSMAGALALKDALDNYVDGIQLKWPNDIYWSDRKLSGTLIETTLAGGHITRCVYGVGLNVNQTEFTSDAPNPVSLCQIVGHEVDRDELLERIVGSFEKMWQLVSTGDYTDIAALYHSSLYRGKGYHCFRDGSGEFKAAIVEVEDDGHLILHNRQGEARSYGFKEVEFII